MTRDLYIVLFILLSVVTGCEKATLPEPIPITPDESTFFVDFLRDGDDNNISIGFEDFVLEPDFDQLGNLIHYKAKFRKSQECSTDCQEELTFTIVDESEYDPENYDPFNSLYPSERLYIKPAYIQESILIQPLMESNYMYPFRAFTQIQNYGGQELLSEDEIISIEDPEFVNSQLLLIGTTFISEDYYWNCNSGVLSLAPQSHSSLADIKVELHEPDSNFVTITASEHQGSTILSGEYVIDTFVNCTLAWNEPLVLELAGQQCNRTIDLVTSNEYANNFSQILIDLDHNTGEILYCVARNSYEYVSEEIMSNTESKVIIEYTDPNGVYYSSTLSDENGLNRMKIQSVESHDPYHNGHKTLKLDVEFTVRLMNDQGDAIDITDAIGTIAVAYP